MKFLIKNAVLLAALVATFGLVGIQASYADTPPSAPTAGGNEIETQQPDMVKDDVEKPDMEKEDMDRPDVDHPDVERPEVDRPEVEKPETN